MIPTIEEQQIIKQVLRDALKFKDTYDEVYDHIISSIEALPDDANVVEALYKIIDGELGGTKGLKALERKHTKLAIGQFIIDYFKALVKPLASVNLILVGSATTLFYYLIGCGWVDRLFVEFTIIIIPLVVLGIAVFKFKQQVKSLGTEAQFFIGYIRQNIVAFSGSFILFFPLFLWETTTIIAHKLKYSEVPSTVCTIMFFIVTLHTFAGYKIYTGPLTKHTT